MAKVLVTGACGFIGSHLTEKLVAEGLDVRALVQYNSLNTWGWLDTIDPMVRKQIDVVAGDVRDPHGIGRIMEGVESVFHLAALIAIPFSYAFPQSYIDTNITGTVNVLQAARNHDVMRIITTSTSEVYGTAEYVPIDERHPLKGQSPYSATKIAADKLAESFHLSFDLPITTVRPFNTYGPRQSARAVIPTIITQLLTGTNSIRLGKLTPTRDMNYVQDTVEGFCRLYKSEGAIGKVVNIASGTEVSVKELAETLIGLINPGAVIACDEERIRPVGSEVERLVGDNALLKQLTGWTPQVSLHQGLSETIEWLRNNIEKYKPDIYNQ